METALGVGILGLGLGVILLVFLAVYVYNAIVIYFAFQVVGISTSFSKFSLLVLIVMLPSLFLPWWLSLPAGFVVYWCAMMKLTDCDEFTDVCLVMIIQNLLHYLVAISIMSYAFKTLINNAEDMSSRGLSMQSTQIGNSASDDHSSLIYSTTRKYQVNSKEAVNYITAIDIEDLQLINLSPEGFEPVIHMQGTIRNPATRVVSVCLISYQFHTKGYEVFGTFNLCPLSPGQEKEIDQDLPGAILPDSWNESDKFEFSLESVEWR